MSQRAGKAEEGRIVAGNISADSETVRAPTRYLDIRHLASCAAELENA